MFKPIIFILALLYLSGCWNNQPVFDGEDPENDPQKRLEAMAEEIRGMIEDKSCNGGGPCEAIAFGAKPCGGPYEYLVYASSKVDEVELEKKVSRYNALQDSLNKANNAVSDCAFVMEPEVGCVDGVCQVVKPYK